MAVVTRLPPYLSIIKLAPVPAGPAGTAEVDVGADSAFRRRHRQRSFGNRQFSRRQNATPSVSEIGVIVSVSQRLRG